MTDNYPRIGRVIDSDVAELQSFSEGDWVEYDDGDYGLVVGKVAGPMEWPTGDEETEQVGEEGEDVYVVARVSGGSKPFVADELNEASESDILDTDNVPENPEEDLDSAEMHRIYYVADEPHGVAELEAAYEELLNIPGVDDPEVGFSSWPDSWVKSEEPARSIAMRAWANMGGTWRGCFAELGSRRLCSAFKDEILGTERWRNRF